MRIAFYAPLKSPDHPVPSGDRHLARMLVAALKRADHRVEVVSQLRSYLGDAEDVQTHRVIESMAAAECNRIAEDWRDDKPPDLWFCYHPYYKSPDRIGPQLCAQFRVPMVTVESSLSARRDVGLWTGQQAMVRAQLAAASLNLCFMQRDFDGIRKELPDARLARLKPFVEMPTATHAPEPRHLVTIAMMRGGNKLESYRALAAAMAALGDVPWRLSIAGDGEARHEVEAMFSGFAPGRVTFLGLLPPEGVQALLARAAVFVWPGVDEVFGVTYLEAQAMGVPVAAFADRGVPEVVDDGVTGILVPPGDVAGLSAAVSLLLGDDAARAQMGADARRKVAREHAMIPAAKALDAALKTVVT